MFLTAQARGLSFIDMTDRFNFRSHHALNDTQLGDLLYQLQLPSSSIDGGACRQIDRLVGDRTAQSTLGSLICQFTDIVNSGRGRALVRLHDGSGRILNGTACSYRGAYEDLCLRVSTPPEIQPCLTAEQFLAKLQAMRGAIYVGYKGGDYVMTDETYVWIGSYGTTGGSARVVAAAYDYETESVHVLTVPYEVDLVVPYSGMDADARLVAIFNQVVRLVWDAAIYTAQNSIRNDEFGGIPKAARPFANRLRDRLERLKATPEGVDTSDDEEST